MRKLTLTCECGQRMQVPRSAIGRMGLCPTCGRTVRISADNTTAEKASANNSDDGGKTGAFRGKKFWGGSGRATPDAEAKRKFGEAVDLFYNQRYGEALAIFNDLARDFPGNREIESGRAECLKMLRDSGGQPKLGYSAPRLPGGTAGAELNEETVKRIVLDKMLNSSSEMVQIQAAELAGKILGMIPRPAPDSPSGSQRRDESADAGQQNPDRGTGDGDGVYSPLKSYPRSIYEL